jgi:hypothetical protein
LISVFLRYKVLSGLDIAPFTFTLNDFHDA